jgi:transposase
MIRKYRVTLTDEQRRELRRLIASGQAPARKLMHARILLKSDCNPGAPGWSAAKIGQALEVGAATVERVRQQFMREGLEAALVRRRSRRVYRRKLDGAGEAHLIALSCGGPPAGRERWTLRLLAERMVTLEHVAALSHETVRRTLKKMISSRG